MNDGDYRCKIKRLMYIRLLNAYIFYFKDIKYNIFRIH